MTPEHARMMNKFPLDAREYLIWYFGLERATLEIRRRRSSRLRSSAFPLLSELVAEVGAGQADVVLALLRTDCPRMLRCAEFLVGRRITRCPPCLKIPRARTDWQDATGLEARRVVHVSPNPRLPNTGAWYRYRVLREGMTVQQALIRGLKKRDLRLARKRGWVRLDDEPSAPRFGASHRQRRAA